MLPKTNIGRLILESVTPREPTVKTASLKYDVDATVKISEGLIKIASIPYKEEVYGNVQEMLKIAAECMKEVSASLHDSQVKNTDFEKAAEVRILLDDMIENGLVSEEDFEEKIAELLKKDEKDLSIIKEAVKISQNKEGCNVFFEKSAENEGGSTEKRGMFDGVL